MSYSNEFNIFEHATKGDSATFHIPMQDDFLIRLDVSEGRIFPRLPLPNCSKYIDLIEAMPEHIKEEFKYSDCKCCNENNCPYTMAYTLEGKDYKQCHFIGSELNSVDDVENLFALICAEQGSEK